MTGSRSRNEIAQNPAFGLRSARTDHGRVVASWPVPQWHWHPSTEEVDFDEVSRTSEKLSPFGKVELSVFARSVIRRTQEFDHRHKFPTSAIPDLPEIVFALRPAPEDRAPPELPEHPWRHRLDRWPENGRPTRQPVSQNFSPPTACREYRGALRPVRNSQGRLAASKVRRMVVRSSV